MTWVDYCILFVFALSVLVGIWRGFTREVLSLLTWVVAFVASVLFSDLMAVRLEKHVGDPALRGATASALVFFGALVLGAVVSHFVVVAVRDSRFSPADRTIGGGLGLIRAVILISLFVLISAQMGASDKRWWRESQMINAFSPLARGFETVIPERWLALLKPATPPITSPGQ